MTRGAVRAFVGIAIAAMGVAATALAQAPGEAPFDAWLAVDRANVRARPAPEAPVVGLLHHGDSVRVSSCVPSCGARGAWAIVDGGGAVALSVLSRSARPEAAAERSAEARYVYGRVGPGGAAVLEAPEASARRLRVAKAGHDLAFRGDAALLAAGFMRLASGGFVRAEAIRMAEPSAFAGEPSPSLPLAFVVKEAAVRAPDGGGAGRALARYERVAVEGRDGAGRVLIEGGAVPRASVRIAIARPRPAGVPAGAKWVHVDLREQVLVAYEGDRPVFATLVSAGKRVPGQRRETPVGLFRVWHKTIHAPMHGDPDDPYFVDEVPWSQFFRRSDALHGAFWHDEFGQPRSHGCVNLSMADARWLFEWGPPALPRGWHGVEPLGDGRESLWVRVERAAPVVLPRVR